jgi:hypothetical protein
MTSIEHKATPYKRDSEFTSGSAIYDGRRTFGKHLISNIVAPDYRDSRRLAGLSEMFLRDDYVRLPGLISEEVYPELLVEVLDLCGKGRHRNFSMPGYDTPRIMTTMGGRQIAETSPFVASLYVHHEIRQLINSLAGEQLYPCRHREEFMVLNHLAGINETHGWHLDDPSYALVIFFEAPAFDDGGLVEMIRPLNNLGEFKRAPIKDSVLVAQRTDQVKQLHHHARDAYLLRADICLHRVTPLSALSARRTALNLAFERTPTPTYGNTASLLYGDETVPLSPDH